MYARSRSASNVTAGRDSGGGTGDAALGRGDGAVERGVGGERRPEAIEVAMGGSRERERVAHVHESP